MLPARVVRLFHRHSCTEHCSVPVCKIPSVVRYCRAKNSSTADGLARAIDAGRFRQTQLPSRLPSGGSPLTPDDSALSPSGVLSGLKRPLGVLPSSIARRRCELLAVAKSSVDEYLEAVAI